MALKTPLGILEFFENRRTLEINPPEPEEYIFRALLSTMYQFASVVDK